MMKFLLSIEKIVKLHPAGWYFVVANILVIICALIVFMAILADFAGYHKKSTVKSEKKSLVETGTMFVYYFVYYLLIKFQIGAVGHLSAGIWFVLITTGLILLLLGCWVNVKGRLTLKHNWANQVTVYTDQTMVTTGVYAWVRHPLYASLIWMLIGGSFIYANYMALLSVIFIFISMMIYRAGQEETLLMAEFPGYGQYRRKTGMFFPKRFVGFKP